MPLPGDMGLEALGLFISYALFAVTFIWRYIDPEKNIRWIVESATSYETLYVFTAAIAMFLVLEPDICCSVPLLAPFMLIFLYMIYKELGHGISGLLLLALYMATVLQEINMAISSPDQTLRTMLFLWYFVGVFVILVGSRVLGPFIDGLDKGLSKRALKLMRKEYGPEAPHVIRSRNGIVYGNLAATPGDLAATGLLYPAWMIFKLVLLLTVL